MFWTDGEVELCNVVDDDGEIFWCRRGGNRWPKEGAKRYQS